MKEKYYCLSCSTDSEDTFKTALFVSVEKLDGELVWKQIGIIDRGCPWGFEVSNAKQLGKDLGGIPYIAEIRTWTPVDKKLVKKLKKDDYYEDLLNKFELIERECFIDAKDLARKILKILNK